VENSHALKFGFVHKITKITVYLQARHTRCVKHRGILCVYSGPIPNEAHYEYANTPKSGTKLFRKEILNLYLQPV
jgi:hypothetical protein